MKMIISILCSDVKHPVYSRLTNWKQLMSDDHIIEIVHMSEKLSGGDILFLISCYEKIDVKTREKYKTTLVVHASDLPLGRGWSPHIWQILEQKNRMQVCLLEATDTIDSGAIWSKKEFLLEGHELADEINDKLFDIEVELINFAISNYGEVRAEEQDSSKATYYRKRIPEDSKLDPEKSIIEQFNLMRVCDPDRYPAFFEYRGYRYNVIIKKAGPRKIADES